MENGKLPLRLSENFESLLERAETFPKDFFQNTKTEFTKDELSSLYGCFLSASANIPFLKELIKEMDALRFNNLDDLIDFLMQKPFDGADLNEIIDLKILSIKAISNYKDTKSIPALLYCLNDKKANYKIRFQAAVALGKIGDKNAVESLINVVSDETEKSVYVRESAAAALGMIGDMRAIDPFLGILEAKKNLLDKFTFLKERIIEALGKINCGGSKRIISAMKNALSDDSVQIRINAIECLMNLDDEKSYDLIKEKLFDKEPEVVENACIALYNLRGEEALFEILKDENSPDFAKNEAKRLLENPEDENE